MFESFIKDLKHSLRMFAKSPAFTFAAVAALTLGIGVNTAIFSVVDAVLLQPLPYPHAPRLVMLLTDTPAGVLADSLDQFSQEWPVPLLHQD